MTTQDIWTEYHEILLKFIRSRVRNAYDAEDILQDVFQKIHQSIQRLEDEGKLQSWVFQITRNAITDYYRRNAKKQELETPDDGIGDVIEEMQQDGNLNHVVSRWIRCIVQDLDEKYREAIILTEFEQITQKELAQRLGISISGAKSRVQRGREKLREKLLECCHLERDRLGNVIDYERKSGSCGCQSCQ
ncbi:RNA polymerase sigma factor SigZ [Paenibacillus antri]|uniref:RNA polymerase sigma factor SigZ n=1 Tax=Paenibacillus antri TaxID=2582848 RepID=A0A5R9G872_9BACL|nr:RNA polymerase sigma factor SigZ [Paenibacillus antri]TLS51931.1 RNA polymerase sigma factor SigZ [Paenibacillus antri]